VVLVGVAVEETTVKLLLEVAVVVLTVVLEVAVAVLEAVLVASPLHTKL
jgi:hypothetical protein